MLPPIVGRKILNRFDCVTEKGRFVSDTAVVIFTDSIGEFVSGSCEDGETFNLV